MRTDSVVLKGDFYFQGDKAENGGMDLIKALRKLHADTVLVDKNGKAWTAEDLEYTLLDELRNQQWNCQAVQLTDTGIYRIGEQGQREELLYSLPETVAASWEPNSPRCGMTLALACRIGCCRDASRSP